MGNKEEKRIRGIRIRTVNYAMVLAACILYLLIIYATAQVWMRYEALVSAAEDYFVCEERASHVREGSDYLTSQVRLYAVTMDPKYVEEYFTELHTTRRRENALESLVEENISQEAYNILYTALEHSNRLMEREIYAMKLISTAKGYDMADFPEEIQSIELMAEDAALIPEKMIEKAEDMLFGPEYGAEKDLIRGQISEFLAYTVETTRQNQIKSFSHLSAIILRQRVYISILFILNIITFIMVIQLIIRPLHVYIRCIKEDKRLEITGSYEFRYLALTYNDIYEINAANEAMLRRRADYDPLTGVINRGAFEQLHKALRKRAISVALMIVDVDKFKEVNDKYGHVTGDKVLQKVAGILKRNFRPQDFVARIGGDEFAVIMTDIALEQETVIQEKVEKMNEELKAPQDGLPAVSLSVGAALSESGFSDDLYRKADSALYRVKENGRCGCAIFDERIDVIRG
ncbi:GGDEF domain-containing protein [Lachnospiraceae bacterium 62-35]